MALLLPPTNPDGTLRYWDEDEWELIDLKLIGVSGEGDHIRDELSQAGVKSTRRYSCAWEERYAAAFALVGFSKAWDDAGTTKVSRLLPDMHPNFVSFNWGATGVHIDPYRYMGEVEDVGGNAKDLPIFGRAYLTAAYELLPYALLDDAELDADGELDRFVTEPGYPGADISIATEYISAGGNTQKFVKTGGGRPAGVMVPYAIGTVETKTRKKVLWRRLPVEVWGPGTPLTTLIKGDGTTANRGMIGALNLTSIWGHPPLTLQMLGVEEKLYPDPSGLGYSWDLAYLFEEKATPFGHTGHYFAEVLAALDGGAASGYYQALSRFVDADNNMTAAAIAAADGSSAFIVREFRTMFDPDG